MSADPPVTQSGVPGFVEVATQVFKSSLAKTVSGLAYSTNNSPNGTSFNLGTSDDQSTQFFMSPVSGTDGRVVYQLRVPILDSTSFKTVDHCATFAISPPGPLTLQNCGTVPGCSQLFSYDSTSGQLQPIYGLSQMLPVGSPIATVLNATLGSQSDKTAHGMIRKTNMTAVTNGTDASMSSSGNSSDATTPQNSTATQNSTSIQDSPSTQNSTSTQDSPSTQNSTSIQNSTTSLTSQNANSSTVDMPSSNGNGSTFASNGSSHSNTTTSQERFMSMPASSSNHTNSSASSSSPAQGSGPTSPSPSIALYFVPAEGFYQKPATIDQMLNSTSDPTLAPTTGSLRKVTPASDDGDDGSDATTDSSDQAATDPSTNAADAPASATPQDPAEQDSDAPQDSPQEGDAPDSGTMVPGSQ